ncbi:MAG: DUF4266 domain-containing protein [Gammaproteobacteria bacterium]|nr:DUF4266 domain-containing protein [Gammaproteobacteria bacterium]
MKKLLFTLPILIFMAMFVSGCQPVQAWERGTLAKPEMAIETDPLETALNNHIYFSKEASNGGHSAAGGGCGCN